MQELLQKFYSKTRTAPNGCILWTLTLEGKYGRFYHSKKKHSAHRFIYEFYNGKIPTNLVIRHLCGNHACVNIDHLQLGTYKENNRDWQLLAVSGKKYALKSKAQKIKYLSLDEKFYHYVLFGCANDCCEWLGTRDAYGYGVIQHKGVTHAAHRLSYKLHTGSIPENMLVRHLCNNRICVNPSHLEIGTDKDNALDKIKSGTSPRGEKSTQAKLTEKDVTEIFLEFNSGSNATTIAKKFNIHPHHVSKILKRERWAHLKDSLKLARKTENHKLDASKVVQIFALRAEGKSCIYIAKLFGVAKQQIYNVLHRRTWKHVVI